MTANIILMTPTLQPKTTLLAVWIKLYLIQMVGKLDVPDWAIENWKSIKQLEDWWFSERFSGSDEFGRLSGGENNFSLLLYHLFQIFQHLKIPLWARKNWARIKGLKDWTKTEQYTGTNELGRLTGGEKNLSFVLSYDVPNLIINEATKESV